MKNTSLLGLVATMLILPATAPAQEAAKVPAGKVTAHSRGLHGYIGFQASRPPSKSDYHAGMGFYSAVWSLVDRPIANF